MHHEPLLLTELSEEVDPTGIRLWVRVCGPIFQRPATTKIILGSYLKGQLYYQSQGDGSYLFIGGTRDVIFGWPSVRAAQVAPFSNWKPFS